MVKQVVLVAVLGVSLLAPSWAGAEAVTIDHSAVGCIVAGQFPKLSACFNPVGDVARARIYFKAEGGANWYFVDMKSRMPCYEGILPKPRKELKKLNYYVEAMSRASDPSRTADYSPDVVLEASACRKDTPAAPFLSNASVTVGSVSGAPLAGFAGAAGISPVLVGAGIVGAGAATAGVVYATGSSSTTTTTLGSGTTLTTQPPQQPPPTQGPPPTQPGENKPPVAVFSVSPDPPEGPAPLTVKFSMCGSVDPDGDPLSYAFDFGDGAKATGSCSASHTYTSPSFARRFAAGSYGASLTVSDGVVGHDRTRNYGVSVTCPSPRVKLTAPTGRSFNSCPVLVAASASDPLGIAQVEFFAKDYQTTTSIGVVTQPPYQVRFTPKTGFFSGGTLIATVTNVCGAVESDQSATVSIFCGGAYGPTSMAVPRRLSWVSQLDVPGGRGQVTLNGSPVSFPRAGRSMAVADAKVGENRVEAQVVESTGSGTWRFELGSFLALQPGSLRGVAGEVVSVSADAIVFRVSGAPGERVAFTFKATD
jgi:hypothetical protein